MKHNHVGGKFGHWFRRCTHCTMIFIPYIYYWHGAKLAAYIDLTPRQIATILACFVVFMEIIRLQLGWVFFGQRHYEFSQISAFTWGTIAIALVLIFAPQTGYNGAAFGFPLIASLAIVDPILGEARHSGLSCFCSSIIGVTITGAIWLLCSYFLQTPLWLIPLIIPVTIMSEWPRLSWIDDNATMLLIPLMVILMLKPFF